MTDDVPRVLLYGRAGCHLCDDARLVVEQVCAESGATWTEVDVDTLADADLRADLSELVPVVEVDGVRQGYWRIDAARLRRSLAAPRVSP
jgi:hypothetical protein